MLIGREESARLLEILGPDYIPLQIDPLQTLKRTGILFVKDISGTRLDLLLSDTEFDAESVRQAVPVELERGMAAQVCRPENLTIYKLISTRPRDHEDAASVVRRQGDSLADEYVLEWLRRFEQALDDSTLVAEYQSLRQGMKS